MYDKLVKDYKYRKENVYLMSSRWYSKYDGSWGWRGHNHGTDGIVDGEAMWDVPGKYDIKDALDSIASRITIHDLLMIVIITHGGPGGFGIRVDISKSEAEQYPERQGESITYSDFGNYLNAKFGSSGSGCKYAVMIIVNQACYSGTMMDYLKGENRILISAADSDHETWTEAAFRLGSVWLQTPYEHFAFIYQGRMKKFYENGQFFFPTYNGFILSMGSVDMPESLQVMYQRGDYAEHHNGNYYDENYSYPQMEYNMLAPEKIYL